MPTYEFYLAKDIINQAKHGLSLSLASELDWAEALAWVDRRRDYGEQRMAALVPRCGRLYCVVFVDREDSRRIISLRRANRREVKRYASPP